MEKADEQSVQVVAQPDPVQSVEPKKETYTLGTYSLTTTNDDENIPEWKCTETPEDVDPIFASHTFKGDVQTHKDGVVLADEANGGMTINFTVPQIVQSLNDSQFIVLLRLNWLIQHSNASRFEFSINGSVLEGMPVNISAMEKQQEFNGFLVRVPTE